MKSEWTSMKFQWNLNAPTGRLRCATNLCTERHSVAQQWLWDYSRHAHTLTQRRKTDRGGEGEKGFFTGLSSRISSSTHSHLWILPLWCSFVALPPFLGRLWQYIPLKRHGPTLWLRHNWASVVEPLLLKQMASAPWQEGVPKKHKST